MLKSQQQGQEDWHPVIEAKERGSLRRSFHKGEVRLEEKCVIVIAEQSLSGEENSLQPGQR